eukprot:TRINITY_DN9349_c0_g1_i1.p1 TRINITY_DN9349_c0_g1~~TRINITY_DN9349_c0_g1_i1.p1  ORF type:complete len:385 (+),score=82.22 TRINITY_DN9349_c0_g1_i1:58-1212(+)
MDDPMAAILANLSSGLAAAESGGDTSPLAANIISLSSGDPLVQERAVRDIINLTLHESNRVAVKQKDGIAPLLKLLREGSKPILRTLAGHALANIALNADCRNDITLQGGINTLSAALTDEPPVVERALAALCNLCTVEDDKRIAAARAGAIPKTLQIIGSSNDKATLTAALMFTANICVNANVAAQVGIDGGADVILRHINSTDPQQQKFAMYALSALSIHTGSHAKIERAIGAFAQALRLGDPEMEAKIFVALVNLSGNESAINDFVGSGAIPEIVNRLNSPNTMLQALALQAVQNLAMSDNSRVSLERSSISPRIMGVLRGGNPTLVPHALRATINLCIDANIRRALRSDGAQEIVRSYTTSSDPGTQDAARQALNNLSVN